MEQLVFLDGQFLPKTDAKVSVMDRGFLFGDGVYEVIPVYGGRLFRFRHHLERLDRSLSSVRIPNPYRLEEWQEILDRLVAQLPGADQGVYLQVTRGAAPKRDHAIPPDIRPTVFAMTNPIEPLSSQAREQGVAAITIDDIRWSYCQIKAVTLLANVLLRQIAAETGAMEAVLIRNGAITEGAASNVFVVQGGRLLTPPKSDRLLPGITRDLVLELAQEAGIPWAEQEIRAEALASADEIWLTSSTKEIVPVTWVDGRAVGTGKPGPVWNRMTGLYQAYKDRVRADPELAG